MDCSLLVRPLGQQQRGALVIYSLSRQASACNWFPLILGHSMHASQTEVITWHKKTFKAFSLQSVPLWPCDALNFLLKVLQGVWRIHIACLGEWNVLCKQSKWRFIQVSVYMGVEMELLIWTNLSWVEKSVFLSQASHLQICNNLHKSTCMKRYTSIRLRLGQKAGCALASS